MKFTTSHVPPRHSTTSSTGCRRRRRAYTGVHGAINRLGLAKRVKAKILQASTSIGYVIHVSDLIKGLRRMMESDVAVTGPINIGNPAEFTMCGLAELVIVLTGSK